MPQPLQPFVHDLICLLAAPTQCWSTAAGDVRPTSAGTSAPTGVLHADLRVLSGSEVRVDGWPGEHIATRRSDDGVVFTRVLRHVGADLVATPDPQVRLDELRTVTPGRMVDELTLTSTLDGPVEVEVTAVLTADATPLATVREGGPSVPAQIARAGAGGLSWRADAVEVEVEAAGAATDIGPDGSTATLRWTVRLPARGRGTVGWQLDARDTAPVVVAAPATTQTRLPPSSDGRLTSWLERSVADLASLRMATADRPDDVFYAAGAPWYLTLFGRDSLWAARMTLPLGLDVARGTLRTLARLQGTRVDPRTAEQPGKIPHELRRTGFQLGGMDLPPLYYGTTDATPLWICLLHDAWRAGLDEAVVVELLPALEAAARWLIHHADSDGDGLVEYLDSSGSGLVNQGWKDSADGVRFADGRLATGSIALCEVQGYAYEAALAAGALLDAFGRPGSAPLHAWAERLRTRFRETFWCGSGADRFPAVALDGDKQRVDSLTSNIGHLLGTGLLSNEEERVVAAHVAGPALDSGLGLRTLAATERAYAPLSYHCGSVWPHDTAIVVDGLHRAGLGKQAAGLVEGLLRASVAFDGRLPELWSGEGAPVPYPAACRPQAWAAAAALVVAHRLDALP